MDKPLADDMTRTGIAVMTAWASDGPAFATDTIRSALQDCGPDGTVDRAAHIIGGLVNLCGLLLVMRQAEQGFTPAETLREIAAKPWNAGPGV